MNKPHEKGCLSILTGLKLLCLIFSESYERGNDMYAIIETGGKQYQVKEGDIVFVEKLEADGEVNFDKVVLVSKEEGVVVGSPYVENVSVKATVLKTGRARKITVFTYKPKKNVKRKQGHRQPYSQVRIDSIIA